jgi:nitrite reductase (NADH) large subunit
VSAHHGIEYVSSSYHGPISPIERGVDMRYVIIGNGVAGTEAALAIRKNDHHGDIQLISESSHLFYYRPRLIEYLSGETAIEKFVLYKNEFYKKNRIDNILNTKITSIDTERKRAIDSVGSEYPFDKLLLATGANPFVPPIEGRDIKGVFTLRGITDAEKIVDFCRGFDNVVVVGGGLLGLESAHSISKLVKNVSVIENRDRLLPRQLDMEGASLLKRMLEKKGLSFYLNESVVKIAGNSRVKRVTLNSGKDIPADAVIISAGIRGRNELAEAAGIKVNRGIVIDNYMQTSIKNIYAAGDPVEHNSNLYGIWPAAREQGKIAGVNMAGVVTEYKGTVFSSTLKIIGIELYSAGDFNMEDSGNYSSTNGNTYMKYIEKGTQAAAIVIGDPDAIKLAQRVM